MNNSSRVALIRERLTNAFHPTLLDVLDESDQHMGHAGHGGGGRHFAIVIAAESLSSLSRVEAHRAIYGLFTDLMPDTIHALRITVR